MPFCFAAPISFTAPPESILRLRAAPLPPPAPAANTTAPAPETALATSASSASRSHTTASKPIASRSEAWSGLRIRPRARSPRAARRRPSRIPTLPCPPAIATTTICSLPDRRPLNAAGRLVDGATHEAAHPEEREGEQRHSEAERDPSRREVVERRE